MAKSMRMCKSTGVDFYLEGVGEWIQTGWLVPHKFYPAEPARDITESNKVRSSNGSLSKDNQKEGE